MLRKLDSKINQNIILTLFHIFMAIGLASAIASLVDFNLMIVITIISLVILFILFFLIGLRMYFIQKGNENGK